MKIAITGATGLVGRALMDVFSAQHPDWELVGLSRKPYPAGIKYKWMPLDISDEQAVYKTITRINPDLVIHAAAMARPEACEKDKDGAMRVNFLGTRNVVLGCMRFDAEMLYFSTDQVFYGAGEKTHEEYDSPRASNYYGMTKILGERYVREHLQRWWIVRMGKVFGGAGDTYSFLYQTRAALLEGRPMRVCHDWAAHMIYAHHLARCVAMLVSKKTYGIYHLAHPELPTYKEAAEYLAGQMGAPAKLLIPISQRELGLSLSRASRLELSCRMWRLDFGQDVPSWKEGVREFAAERVKS